MPAEQAQRAEQVVAAYRERLTAEVCEVIGEQGFADLAAIVQEALQRERADVAGQFEALAKALRATAEAADLGM
jgi:hypothetical protein